MIPLVSDVYALTRAHLGDTAVTNGQLWTNTFLANYWPSAWSALYRWLDRNGSKRLRRTQYYNVPANTGALSPADLGIANLGKPVALFDRTIATSATATIAVFNATSLGVPSSLDLTMTAHGLATGQQVVAFGFNTTNISDDVNADWYITAVDANTIRLMGCAAKNLSSAVGTFGIISTGTSVFSTEPIRQLFDIEDMPLTSAGSAISAWKWDSGVMRLTPCTSNRQIKFVYMLSGSAPSSTTQTVGIDDSVDALSLFLAASCAAAKGFNGKSQALFMRAIGNPSGDTTNIMGGAFYELAQIAAQEINDGTPVVMPRFRPRRNVGPRRFYA